MIEYRSDPCRCIRTQKVYGRYTSRVTSKKTQITRGVITSLGRINRGTVNTLPVILYRGDIQGHPRALTFKPLSSRRHRAYSIRVTLDSMVNIASSVLGLS